MKASISYQEFINRYENDILINKPKCVRKGQALMIFLSQVWNCEYIRISSVHYYEETNIDCFYNDNLINNTLNHLKNVWEY